jgi:uncharacterized oligopeptide transporter (OPT) family protein
VKGAADLPPSSGLEPATGGIPGLTLRSVVAGLILSGVLCAMNSYLTLSFGVIEEGPTIAAVFFFACFFLARRAITTTEMVIVATMGSAGGSLGFISNFYAAKAMTGEPYSVLDMTLFGIVSSLVGMIMVIPLRQILVLREKLPWPMAKAVEGVIKSLTEHGDRRQPMYLLVTFVLGATYVILNTDGFGVVPSETALGALVLYGGAIAWSPFAIGGSYLMGMRTCVGFLFGAAALMVLAPYTPTPEAPHRYFWPGLGFLVSSGLTVMALNWRTLAGAFRSILSLGGKTDDDDPILPGKVVAAAAVIVFVVTALVLKWRFAVPFLISLVLIVVAGLIQNIIATRAAAQTAFNPARVMGILLQGVTSAMGGAKVATNLTGAGFVAGSGAQASMLTTDMVYGRAFRVPSRWQFWAQAATVLPCAIISALVFTQIHRSKPLVLDGPGHSAPVAKMWAKSAQIFEAGMAALPPGALQALLIGALIGIIYTVLEHIPALKKWMPETIGLGLGLVLAPALGIAFFIGGFIMWIVLGRWFKVSDVTLTTIAIGAIVAEGIGGVLQSLLLQFFRG